MQPVINRRDDAGRSGGGAVHDEGAVRSTAVPRAASHAAPRSIPEQIAEDVGAAIIAGRHRTGDRLVETDLAQAYGVSRGPVREALRILERRRLIDLLPRRGAYVREVSLNSIADLFNTRLALSSMAARYMAMIRPRDYLDILRRRFAELHGLARAPGTSPEEFAYCVTRLVRAITRGSGNELLNEVMTDLANHTVWTTIWKTPLDYLTPASRRSYARRLAAVLEAIEGGDGEQAECRLRAVLEADRDQAIAVLAAMRGERCERARLLKTAAGR